MAEEMRAIGVDQDEENGSLGNHIADDGSNVAEAERLVTVTEDLQHILAQVNAALERMNEGPTARASVAGSRSAKSASKRFPMWPTASSASPSSSANRRCVPARSDAIALVAVRPSSL